MDVHDFILILLGVALGVAIAHVFEDYVVNRR